MNKDILSPGIVIYYDVIDNSMNLIELINDNFDWGIGEAAASRYLKKNGSDVVRKVSTFFLTNDKSTEHEKENKEFLYWSNTIQEKLELCIKDYLDMYDIDTVLGVSDWYQILKYEIGDMFSDHIDDVPDARRFISGVYYFNEDYIGGEIYFKHFNLKIKPPKNSYVIFPSIWVYSHSAEPVLEGKKYGIVNFFI